MAKLAEDYLAVPPGKIYPVQFRKGEDVCGEIENMARRDGKIAQPVKVSKASRKSHGKAPENK